MSRPPGGRAPLRSLRARLLGLVGAAVAATALAVGAVAWRGARAEADAVFDERMRAAAHALVAVMRAGGPAAALPALAAGSRFELSIEVPSAFGVTLLASDGAPPPLANPPPGFSTFDGPGGRLRLYALAVPQARVQVTQPMAERRRLADEAALRAVAPLAWLAPALLLLAWGVVTLSLAPVARLGRQLAARPAERLEPLDMPAALPDELRPLLAELNALLARVRGSIDGQRRFVADAAHELRSPLAALTLQLQAVERADDEAARAEGLARLRDGLARASRLVEQMLALARQEGAPPAPRPVSLRALAGELVVERGDRLHAAGRALDLGVDGAVPDADALVVDGDADALAVLLGNLVDNAVKATADGGAIDVRLERDADGVPVLAVEDSGPGIPEAERARVVDRFYRVPGGPAGGSGLGLSIVSAIARAHGATLSLEDSPRRGGLRAAVRFGGRDRPAST